ncbi:acylphosphatase [Candidatus Uhrbacteria bacterium]|nr:acylphosphatase [Candidatus Uhrbacteria bacterium]
MTLNKRRIRLIIRGIVQGVGFRHHARHQATLFGVAGFIQNHPDGGVVCVIEGDEIAIGHFIRWCRKGPTFAHVQSVDEQEEQFMEEFRIFEVR